MRSAHGLAFPFFSEYLTIGNNLILNEIPKGCYPLGLAQFLWVCEKNRHIRRFNFWTDMHNAWFVLTDIIGKYANPQIL